MEFIAGSRATMARERCTWEGSVGDAEWDRAKKMGWRGLSSSFKPPGDAVLSRRKLIS
jgi:hypothetical protein